MEKQRNVGKLKKTKGFLESQVLSLDNPAVSEEEEIYTTISWDLPGRVIRNGRK